MYPQKIQVSEIRVLVIGLCIFTISACKKKENSSNDFIQEAGRTAPNNTNQPHPVTNAVKIWKDFNLSDIDKLDDSISGIEVRIKVRNQLAVQTDVGSFATSARLESSIAKGIGKLLKSQPNSAISARLLLKQIAVSPLSAKTLAYAFSIELNDKQKKAISVSRSTYEAFSTLFAAMSGEPSVEIQNQILSSGTDDWITSGKWPFMNLNFIIEARVQLAAAEVLIQYVEKGGKLNIDNNQIGQELKRLMPESFEDERLPEAGFMRSSHLYPSDVISLLVVDK